MTDRSTITKSRLLLCAASLSLVMTAPSSGRGEPLRQLRVDAPGEALADELAARGFDLLPRRAGAAIDIVADAEDFARLDELGVVYSVSPADDRWPTSLASARSTLPTTPAPPPSSPASGRPPPPTPLSPGLSI